MALSIAWSLAWVSASSVSGSLSATIPPPANSRARFPSSSAHRSDRPLTVAVGVDPAYGAAVPAAFEALDCVDQLERRVTWVRRRRPGSVAAPRTSSRTVGRGVREPTLDERAEVLNVGDRDDRRLGLPVEIASTRGAMCRAPSSIAMRCSIWSLVARLQLGSELGVELAGRPSCGCGPCEWVRAHDVTVDRDEQFGTGADEAVDREAVARAEGRPEPQRAWRAHRVG